MKRLFILGLLLTTSLVGCGDGYGSMTKENKEQYKDFKGTVDDVYDVLKEYDLKPEKDRAEDGPLEGKITEVESNVADNGYFEVDYEVWSSTHDPVVVILTADVNMSDANGEMIDFKFEDSLLGDLREVILGSRKPSEDVDSVIRDVVEKGEPLVDYLTIASSATVTEQILYDGSITLRYELEIK